MSKVVSVKSHLYLVINDCRSDDQRALSIQISHQRPNGGKAKKIVETMLDVMSNLKLEEDAILKTGELPSQRNHELLMATHKIVSNKGFNKHENFLTLQMFNDWISHSVQEIESKVRIRHIERKIAPLVNRLQLLASQLALLEKNPKVISDSRVLIADDLRLRQIQRAVGEVISILNGRILPMFKIRIPDLYLELKKSGSRELTQIHIGQDPMDILHGINVVIDSLNKKMNIRGNDTSYVNGFVAVNYPKLNQHTQTYVIPYADFSGPVALENLVVQPYEALSIAINPPLVNNPRLSSSVVGQYNKLSVGRFTVRPQDVYVMEKDGLNRKTAGALVCEAQMPVI